MTRINETKPATAHTPRPWDYDLDYIVAPDPDGRHPDIYIAEIAHSDDEGRIASPRQQDANRRLIAAAPDLLTALLAASEWLDAQVFIPRTDIQATIQAAVAKATAQNCDGR